MRTLFRLFCILALAAGFSGRSISGRSSSGRPKTAAGGWSLVFDKPFNGKYEDFAFPTPKQGWLISAAGDIYHSSDGGTSWALQASGKGRLRSIDMIDEHRGFAGTLAGVLYRTDDGGETWTDITSTLPRAAKGFCGMTHVGNEVHIIGRYQGPADYFYSPDGGKTWRGDDMLPLAQGLVEVQFLNSKLGLIGGMSNTGQSGQGPAAILKTTDGGQHWHTVFTDAGGRGFVWKIWPVSPKLIYASLQSQDGTYRIAKSTDLGDTWEVMTAVTGRPMGPGVQGLGFVDEQTGWIGGFFQGMYATTDGGKSWSFVDMPDRTINRFEKIGNTMFTAGTRGILRYDAPPAKK